MDKVIEKETQKAVITYSASSIPYTITSVLQHLHNKDMSEKEIVNEILDGDKQLFDMISLFLYSNRWLTRDNVITEQGRL